MKKTLKMNWWCPLLLLLSSPLVTTSGLSSGMEEVEELLKLESTIDLKSANQLILLLGSTGTGKSTLIKLLIDDKSLQLKKVGTSSYIFEDNGIVGNNIRKSMTVLPNIFQDPQTKDVIVDLPGFCDTREPKYEIANAFFIKKVLEYPKKLKIIVTENYHSMTEGIDRFGFSRLLRALSELVPNIEKLKGSMALVATKADRRGNAEDVKLDLINFLNKFKTYLEEDLNSKANVTVRGMLKALDVLSGHNPAENVAFFWRPMVPRQGWLPVDDLNAESRASIRSLIFDKMSWADNTHITYHYSVSKESVYFIKHHLAPASIDGTKAELSDFFASFKESAQSKISNLTSSSKRSAFTSKLKSNLTLVGNLTTVDEICNLTESLRFNASIYKVNANVVKHLSSRVKFFKGFGVDVVKQLNQEIRTEVRHLGRWLNEVAQRTRQLQKMEDDLEEQKNATLIAKALAKSTIQNAEKLVNNTLTKSALDRQRLISDAEKKVIAAENALRVARENKGTDSSALLQLFQIMLNSQTKYMEAITNIAIAQRPRDVVVQKESPGEVIKSIMTGVASMVETATQQKPTTVNGYGLHQVQPGTTSNQLLPQQYDRTVSQGIAQLWSGVDYKQPNPPFSNPTSLSSNLYPQTYLGSASNGKPEPLSG